ncbi:MAG: class I SAM-dependent methyltransferase [Candidatus Omnitrophica bacterium]|nr:class I SAM-dependent methyltransferase [Candidatus Omnitrophota bacterium]
MKKELLQKLQFNQNTDWDLTVFEEDAREIRKGVLRCKGQNKEFMIEDGILNMLCDLPPEVVHEKEHAEQFDYLVMRDGEKAPINRATIEKHKELFLSLPAGDGSSLFKPGGSFDNQGGNAERFFKTLELLNLTGKEKILEVGTSFGWASRRFAQKGCDVVGLDVTNYMMAADYFFDEDGIYFDRVMSDMSQLPFKNETFDLIFSHSVIHHCKDLAKLFSEFARVLKPGGRVVALHECSFGLLEDKSGKALQEAIDDGFNENAYTVPQWKKGALQGGFSQFKTHFFSFIDDYVYRKELRQAKETFKLRLAKAIQKIPVLNALLNGLSVWPRILLRPKAWLFIATK